MAQTPDPLAADRQFFKALLEADGETLEQLLGDDFVIIDVMAGAEVPRAAFVEAVRSGRVKFDSIEPSEGRARMYRGTAVVIGRTQMKGRFGETPFSVSSRYTHVFVEQAGRWHLVAAQGTQIAPQPATP